MTKHLLAITAFAFCVANLPAQNEYSTSNGPTPAIEAPMAGNHRERSPLRLAGDEKESPSLINGISVSPYYTLGYENFSGATKSGVGLDIGLNLSKTVQVVSFMETDDPEGSFMDRFGLGLQMTGKLGRWLKPYARLSGGHVFDSSTGLAEDSFFLRPEFGAIIDIWRKGNWHVSIDGSFALDVDTNGNADKRLKAGLVFGTSF